VIDTDRSVRVNLTTFSLSKGCYFFPPVLSGSSFHISLFLPQFIFDSLTSRLPVPRERFFLPQKAWQFLSSRLHFPQNTPFSIDGRQSLFMLSLKDFPPFSGGIPRYVAPASFNGPHMVLTNLRTLIGVYYSWFSLRYRLFLRCYGFPISFII